MSMLWAVVYNFQQGRGVETKIYKGVIGASRKDTIKQFYKDVEFSDPRAFLKDVDRVYYSIQFVLWVDEVNILDYRLPSSRENLAEWYANCREKYADTEYQQYLKLKEKFGNG